MLQGRLTDLELSGAVRMPPGAAGRRRRTRPLERLVSFQTHDVAEGNTKSTERHRITKSTLPASLEPRLRHLR